MQHTIEVNSAINPVKTKHASYQLRMEREKNTLRLLSRTTTTEEWQLLKIIERTDFSPQLQVGLAAYSSFPGNGPKMKPDIRVQFNQTQILQR
jgi:hypothetical protein